MRYGLLADVHANLPALEAVLAALDDAHVDRVVVAGDLVGYGPRPNDCVERLIEAGAFCVAGNHDLYACGLLDPRRLSELASISLAWTRENLGADVVAHLSDLPLVARLDELLVAHGAPDDPERYIATEPLAREQLDRVVKGEPGTKTLVLGHTHHQWLFSASGAGFRPRRPAARRLSDAARLVNPGSVGQSRQREREPLARFAVLDTAECTVHFQAVAFDVASARRDLAAAGLPAAGLHLVPPRGAGTRRFVRRARRSLRTLALGK